MTIHPLILSTFDLSGGAARATYRLHEGLRRMNIDSRMLVQYKTSHDSTIIGAKGKVEKVINQMRPTLDNLPLNNYKGRGYGAFSTQWFPDLIKNKIIELSPNIINLHWTCGFVQIETIPKLNKPLVWTLHDMWTITGGCHYSQKCDRFTQSCGACPQLHSEKDNDISRWVWKRKAKYWQNLDITIVTPSIWLAKSVRASSLFRQATIEVIPNGIDTQRYKPGNRKVVREWLNLPQDKQLILIGANSLYLPRKGSQYLSKTLELLQTSDAGNIELVIFGTVPDEFKLDLGFKSHYMGNLGDDISLAQVYASADVFVAPYIEDNLPNTIMEALACGTPCVAFDIGGIAEMILHEYNGYLAKPFDVEQLASGIAWILADKERWEKLCDRARQKVECEFSQELQASRYSQLFAEVIENYGVLV
jgi:glycosyltransferase involved in cell wall biosynthesis